MLSGVLIMFDGLDSTKTHLADSSAAEKFRGESELAGKNASLVVAEDTRRNAAAAEAENPGKCTASEAYLEILNTAYNHAYSPEDFGDIKSLRQEYDCRIKNDDDAVKYADEALKILDDPYSDVHPADEVKQLKSQMAGQFYGLGLTLLQPEPGENGRFPIKDLLKGGAAESAGLKENDRLVKIDGQALTDLNAMQVSNLIRSTQPNAAQLTIERDGKLMDFSITRKLIENHAVKEPELKDGIEHIHISTFDQSDTAIELKNAIEKYPEAKAYIIDLRKDGGGLVDQAFKSLSLFMSKGVLAQQRDRMEGVEGDTEARYFKTTYSLEPDKIGVNKVVENMPEVKVLTNDIERLEDIVHGKPVVVLVDDHTASAAEIFAAAMQDNKEATVIGSQTLGKGITQIWMEGMPQDSILSITNSRLFTPSGKWLGDGHHRRIGITPDIVIPDGQDALEASFDYLKKMLASKSDKTSAA